MKYAIGISLNFLEGWGILLKEDGEIVQEINIRRKKYTVNESIELLIELSGKIIEKSSQYKDDILGVGFAVGGIVDYHKGIVYWPQQQDSTYVYVAVHLDKYFKSEIKYPIVIENDANAAAWAEYKTNYSSYNNIIYMLSGVGCGLILDKKLYRGRDGSAGELFIVPHKMKSTYFGDFSFLYQWPIDLGLTKRIKEGLSTSRLSSLVKKRHYYSSREVKDIFKEIKKDHYIGEIIKEAGFTLGIKISFLVNLFNPEVVIIGGGLEKWGERLLEGVKSGIKKFTLYENKKKLIVEFSSLQEKSSALGVAHLIFENKK